MFFLGGFSFSFPHQTKFIVSDRQDASQAILGGCFILFCFFVFESRILGFSFFFSIFCTLL